MSVICTEMYDWIEEWVEEEIQKCKQKKCKWWCACCNKWFCWIEIALVKVGQWVARVVCEVVSVALDALAGILSLIFMIPILGRLLRQLWSFVIELIWRIIGLIGELLDWLGIDIEKKYRICIIILSKQGKPLTTAAALQPTIQAAQAVWKSAANVKLIVEDIHTVIKTDERDRNLKVDCDFGAWTDDIFLTGSNFELYANTYCFYGTGRRLIGWASPVVVFVVEEIVNKLGCSLGIFTDYVTIEAGNPKCLAHELGHAVYFYLPQHHSDPNNLMHSSCNGTQLKEWQKILMRDSRHITYL
jgi:hypothetical protein